MFAPFGTLVRGLVALGVLACTLAVGVARLVPQPSGFRLWSTARHAAFNGAFFSPAHMDTEVLNTETGQVSSLRLPEGDSLQWAGFSDWIDEDGESIVVGRWTSSTGSGGDRACEGIGIGRFSFPSGRPLDRVRIEHTPVSTPCWYPASAGRVLFAAADGMLYHYQFSGTRSGNGPVTEDTVQPIVWPNPPADVERIWIQEPSWPKDPRLSKCLFAVVGFRLPPAVGRKTLPYRIWWLRLNAAGTTIVDSGRLARDEADSESGAAEDVDERYPTLVPTRGGDLTLAYYLHQRHRNRGEVRLAPIELDPRTHAPFIRHGASKKLVDNCLPTPPAFTPSGEGLFALVGTPTGAAAFKRVDFSDSRSPRTRGALARRHGQRRAANDSNPG